MKLLLRDFLLFCLLVLFVYPFMCSLNRGLVGATDAPLVFAPDLGGKHIQIPFREPKAKIAKGLDLDRLARAVARHETGGCKLGSGRTHRNAFGIMQWNRQGQRSFKRYKTCEDSYQDFKRIWSTYYKRFPDWALADKYAGGDRTAEWLANVTAFYHAL